MQERDYAEQALGDRFCPRCGEPYTGAIFGTPEVAVVVNGVTLLDRSRLPTHECYRDRHSDCESRCFLCSKHTKKYRWRYIECFPRRVCSDCVKLVEGGAK